MLLTSGSRGPKKSVLENVRNSLGVMVPDRRNSRVKMPLWHFPATSTVENDLSLNANLYPAPETLSHDSFVPILTRLKLLLDNLPDALPSHGNTSEKFAIFLTQPDDFVLDPDWMEKTECEVATLSEMLKKVFGWSATEQLVMESWNLRSEDLQPTTFGLAPAAARSLTVDEAFAMWD